MIVWLFLPGSQRRAFPVENELCVSCRRLEIWPRAQRSAFEHEMWIVDWTEDERPGARCLQLSPDAGRCAARGSSALCSHGCLNMLEPAGTATATGTTPLRSGRVPGVVYEVWCDMDLTRATIYLSAVGPAVAGWSGLDILIESGSTISSK